jgi:hypothetical protein
MFLPECTRKKTKQRTTICTDMLQYDNERLDQTLRHPVCVVVVVVVVVVTDDTQRENGAKKYIKNNQDGYHTVCDWSDLAQT